MLGWLVTFLVIAIVAAMLGFGAIAGVAYAAARIIFWIVLALLVISLLVGMTSGRGFGGHPTP